MSPLNLPKRYLMVGSLAGLGAGLGLGIVAQAGNVGGLIRLSEMLAPLGTLWVNSLRMVVLPLLVSYIIIAVASFSEAKSAFRVGGGAVLAHLALMGVGLALMLTIVPHVVSWFEVTPAIREALSSTEIPAPSNPSTPASGLGDVISQIIPTNLFRAAANDQILPLFVGALLFALALTRVPEEPRALLVGIFQAIIDTLHVLIGWILRVMPFGVFVLVFAMTAKAGADVLGALAFFVVAFCGLLILLTGLLYLVTPLLGRVSLSRFARAVAPAQIVALGSRSSIVCLPALMEGASERLRLPESVSGLVLPLSVSMFKINKAVSGPVTLFFLMHLYGIELSPLAIATFFLAYVPTSFSSPGIPSGGFFVSLPLYIALGIPLEGYILVKAVDDIPDIFKTLANVTGDMSVTAIVTRFAGSPESVPVPAPAV
ncbi:MAG: dicarboxylate/amino acid:cation symporter [Rubricoccaceae bacterium]